MKGPLTGLASWDAIKAVSTTGAQGVMSAEGNLHNPALFAGSHPAVWEVADEYLRLVRRYPCPLSYARGHVFKMLHYCLLMPANHDVRALAARANRLEQLEEAVSLLRERYHRYTEEGGPVWSPGPGDEVAGRLPLSPFLCQPHEREPIAQHLKKMEANQEKQRRERQLRLLTDQPPPETKRPRQEDAAVVSKRKQKKMARGVKIGVNRVLMERCGLCCNPRGQRCPYQLCRVHCRNKCYEENLDCVGHRILCKTKRQKAQQRNSIPEAPNGAKCHELAAEGGEDQKAVGVGGHEGNVARVDRACDVEVRGQGDDGSESAEAGGEREGRSSEVRCTAGVGSPGASADDRISRAPASTTPRPTEVDLSGSGPS
ncbi:tRNA-dihydrouridine(16/17) synthase [NAD(P)(+)]-like [Pollicipes pollicipes]|uniref:tRNA-dihydrouridine(16/17) synthase [NAD(P)(+)]-like n=1 Tax=Pollicipes pollicipes TaxID=41117 RepID=UPI0018855F12|nr:tRNA-dihydrouridine(16/17) synthase [NAD(P)(+)]-like [Pollicipes pollicipes]